MKKQCFAVLIILLLTAVIYPLVSANNNDVWIDPDSFSLDVCAGCGFRKDVVLHYDIKTPFYLILDTEVYPDSEGVDVSYSISRKHLISEKDEFVVSIYVQTSMLLTPGTYLIVTEAGYQAVDGPFKPSGGSGGYIFTPGEPVIVDPGDDNIPLIPVNPDNPDDLPYNPYLPSSTTGSGFDILGSWLVYVLISALIVTFLVLFIFRRRKNSKGEEKK